MINPQLSHEVSTNATWSHTWPSFLISHINSNQKHDEMLDSLLILPARLIHTLVTPDQHTWAHMSRRRTPKNIVKTLQEQGWIHWLDHLPPCCRTLREQLVWQRQCRQTNQSEIMGLGNVENQWNDEVKWNTISLLLFLSGQINKSSFHTALELSLLH